MAANTPVGNVNSFQLITLDANTGDPIITTISNKKLLVRPDSTYSNADATGRALAGLSRNSYRDVNLITSVSVSEQMSY